MAFLDSELGSHANHLEFIRLHQGTTALHALRNAELADRHQDNRKPLKAAEERFAALEQGRLAKRELGWWISDGIPEWWDNK